MKKVHWVVWMILLCVFFFGCENGEKPKDGETSTNTPAEEAVFEVAAEDVETFLKAYTDFLSRQQHTVGESEIPMYEKVDVEDFKIYENSEEFKKDFPNLSSVERWEVDAENLAVCLIMDVEYATELQQKQISPEFKSCGVKAMLLRVHKDGKNMRIQDIVWL